MFIAQTRLIRGGDRVELARFAGVVRSLNAACSVTGVASTDVEPLVYDLRYLSHLVTRGITQHTGAEGPYEVLHLEGDFWLPQTADPLFRESFSFTLPLGSKAASSPRALIAHVIRTRLVQASLLGSFGDQRDRARLALAQLVAGHAVLEHPELIDYRDRHEDIDETQSAQVVSGDFAQLVARVVPTERAPLYTNPETGD